MKKIENNFTQPPTFSIETSENQKPTHRVSARLKDNLNQTQDIRVQQVNPIQTSSSNTNKTTNPRSWTWHLPQKSTGLVESSTKKINVTTFNNSKQSVSKRIDGNDTIQEKVPLSRLKEALQLRKLEAAIHLGLECTDLEDAFRELKKFSPNPKLLNWSKRLDQILEDDEIQFLHNYINNIFHKSYPDGILQQPFFGMTNDFIVESRKELIQTKKTVPSSVNLESQEKKQILNEQKQDELLKRKRDLDNEIRKKSKEDITPQVPHFPKTIPSKPIETIEPELVSSKEKPSWDWQDTLINELPHTDDQVIDDVLSGKWVDF